MYRWNGGIDAIDAYSRRLVREIRARGVDASYAPNGLTGVLAADAVPNWVLLQYNPFRWGHSGFAPRMLRDALWLRTRLRIPLVVMVHEAWIDMSDAKSTAIGLWQRAQLRALLRFADGVMTSTQALAAEIGRGAVHLPVASNVTPLPTTTRAARERLGLVGRLTVGLFGRGHPSRAMDYAEAAIAALAEAHGADELVIFNLGADAPPVAVPPGAQVSRPGRLNAGDLSTRLWASDLVLLPYTDGVSTRRGTLMAALAHGRPVLALRGPRTDAVLAAAGDALVLTPLGDRPAFARRAVELTCDLARLRAIGDAGRQLYESRFDWPILAENVVLAIEKLTGDRPGPKVAA